MEIATMLQYLCDDLKITCDVVSESPEHLAIYLPPDSKAKVNQVTHRLMRLMEGARARHLAVNGGVTIILSDQKISEELERDVRSKALVKYDRLYNTLSTIVNEYQYKNPTTVHDRRSSNTGQYPNAFNAKTKKSRTLNQKLEEALSGIATPNDVQPQALVAGLEQAMADIGLDKKLKAAGISWHVAEPGKHSITFNKEKTPVFQVGTLELSDPKGLTSALAALDSMADGKAPQSSTIEQERIKGIMDKFKERQGKYEQVAGKYSQQPKPEPLDDTRQ